MSFDRQETRPQTILRVTRLAWDSKAINLSDFGMAVAVAYYACTPSSAVSTNLRTPDESSVAAYEKVRLHNRKAVERHLTGDARAFPADLEEPWVNSLPEPFRTQALRELASRYGLLAATARNANEALISVSEMATKAGAVLQTMAPIIADGKVDEKDRPFLKAAIQSIAALQAELASAQAMLAEALPNERELRIVA